MGKNLKGKDIGKGISQRKDGLYMGRSKAKGRDILFWRGKSIVGFYLPESRYDQCVDC